MLIGSIFIILVLAVTNVSAQTLFSDYFNRAGSASPGGNWTIGQASITVFGIRDEALEVHRLSGPGTTVDYIWVPVNLSVGDNSSNTPIVLQTSYMIPSGSGGAVGIEFSNGTAFTANNLRQLMVVINAPHSGGYYNWYSAFDCGGSSAWGYLGGGASNYFSKTLYMKMYEAGYTEFWVEYYTPLHTSVLDGNISGYDMTKCNFTNMKNLRVVNNDAGESYLNLNEIVIQDQNPVSIFIDYNGTSVVDNAVVGYTNPNNLTILTFSNIGGTSNTTAKLYNTAGTLLATHNVTNTQNVTNIFYNLSVGTYKYNVTVTNFTGSASTSTRTWTLYPPTNITFVTPPTPVNGTVIELVYPNNLTIQTMSQAGILSNSTIRLYNSGGLYYQYNVSSENATISFTNLTQGIYYFNATVMSNLSSSNTETRLYIIIRNVNITYTASTPANNSYVPYTTPNNITIGTTSGFGLTNSNTTASLYNNSGVLLATYNTSNENATSVFFNLVPGIYRYNVTVNNFTASSSTETRWYNVSSRNESLMLNILDEITQARINETLFFSINSETYYENYTIQNGSYYLSGIPVGDYIITLSNENYSTRQYVFTIAVGTQANITARLLNIGNSTTILLETKTSGQVALPGVIITLQRQYNGGNWATVSQKVSDTNGKATVFLQQGTFYKIILSATGYNVRSVNQEFYTSGNPYVYLLDASSSGQFIYTMDGIKWYYYPTYIGFKGNASNNFYITTYNATSSITSTSIDCNNTIYTVVGSPSGGTAGCSVNLIGYNGTYNVTYSFRYLDPNSGAYINYTIPIIYLIGDPTNITTPLIDVIHQTKNDIGSTAWLAILSVLLVFASVATIQQLSGNILASIGTGYVALIALAAVGWVPIPLVAIILVSSGLLLYMGRS
jgi:hypothetical protein